MNRGMYKFSLIFLLSLGLMACDPSDVPAGGGTTVCTADSDCNDGFCGWLADNSRVCKPWADVGDSCRGFVRAEDRAFCDPSLHCLRDPSDPTFDLPGTCVETCASDSDCNDGFCGYADNSSNPARICKPFQAEWDYCGGFVQPADVTQCAPDFLCYNDQPNIPDAPGVCSKECSLDSDCTDSFCGYADNNGTQICKPFQQEGDTCGGFVQPIDVTRCDAGLYCYNDQPNIPDLPGVCTAICTTNSDCDQADFCGFTHNGARICKPRGTYGDSCGGFVVPEARRICEIGLSCVGGPIVDLPGVCELRCTTDADCVGYMGNAGGTCGLDQHQNQVCRP